MLLIYYSSFAFLFLWSIISSIHGFDEPLNWKFNLTCNCTYNKSRFCSELQECNAVEVGMTILQLFSSLNDSLIDDSNSTVPATEICQLMSNQPFADVILEDFQVSASLD